GRAPACPSLTRPTHVSVFALLQVGDEPLSGGRTGGCAGPGPVVVVQGSTRVVQGVVGSPGISEEEGDGEAGPPGSVDVAPGLFVLDGLLVMAQGLPGVPRPPEDVAELVLVDTPVLVVVGVVQVQGLLVVAEGGVEVLQQHRLGLTSGAGVVV